ncbi:4'-phosphopantetheinyl transferase family protein [Desulfofustis glycolicus]|uniref:4'-phosphopantetheinyl transferase n=1 Tax=Desulfofustis glycolicus DSM 9705 TaxID=1121409 RepID=A0A1M5TA69_9BACT|nr:4'-phosphopantetheinyl transferase superfamily protein [Desulfofustis glycolicus]MCB2215441.1 4'-phosphopantetheinyl transferase superfamily protein [Desulfobulbaceae bacterium]SHH47601.1 4'-phosphopantetheinyl transferase [Desulfofustis glycolicus DSM 9705]
MHFGEPLAVELEAAFLAELPPLQQQAIFRLKRWQDRQRSLLGRMLLRRALSLPYGGAGRFTLQTICQTERGRPLIPGGPDFNLSHSGETVVLAVCSRGQVGIDIEAIRPIDVEQFQHIVPELADAREETGGSGDLRSFYDYWTRKEAVVKGCGLGLALPFEQLDVSRDVVAAAGSVWHLRSLIIGGGDMSCHIATNVPPSGIFLESLTRESLHP